MKGTFTVENDVATINIDWLGGNKGEAAEISNFFELLGNVRQNAKLREAVHLRITANIENARLLGILRKRYGWRETGGLHDPLQMMEIQLP